MFKPKNKKEEAKEIKEVVEAVNEEVIEDEVEEVVGDEPSEETTDDKPSTEQKVNLTPGEVISIVEFNLQRAIQSLQLLK